LILQVNFYFSFSIMGHIGHTSTIFGMLHLLYECTVEHILHAVCYTTSYTTASKLGCGIRHILAALAAFQMSVFLKSLSDLTSGLVVMRSFRARTSPSQ